MGNQGITITISARRLIMPVLIGPLERPRDGLDVACALEQRVEEPDIAVAAQPEDVRHLFAHEVIDDDLAAVEDVGGHRFNGRRRRSPTPDRGRPSTEPAQA